MNLSIQALSKNKIFHGIVRHVYKEAGRAMYDYKMLCAKDKVLITISGGFGSLTLIELFLMRKRRIPIDFEVMACFVDTDFINIDKGPLIKYLDASGIEYVIKSPTLAQDNADNFWCSLSRRKVLFEEADKYGCNKIALGHDLDDIIETTLINFFFKGEISTLKPKIELFEGKLAVIRPLCYLEKAKIMEFALAFSLPDTRRECTYEKDPQRNQIKEIINKLHEKYPFIKKNIYCALDRIKKDYIL